METNAGFAVDFSAGYEVLHMQARFSMATEIGRAVFLVDNRQWGQHGCCGNCNW